MTFDQLISAAAASKASDIHLRAGHPPLVRINGDLQRWQSVAALTPASGARRRGCKAGFSFPGQPSY